MISIKNLHKKFGDNRVLNGLSLEINPGELLGIIGPSGCGKSVLLKHIIGLMKPDEGEIHIDGVDITKFRGKKLRELRLLFGMVFQGSALFDSLSAKENIAFPLRQHTNLTDEEIEERVKEKMHLVGLRGVGAKSVGELSGGMKKRVAIARAIIMQPRIILYDEPTTGIDLALIEVINTLILDLQKRLQVTSVVVTHDLANAYKICQRLAIFHQGKIVEVDSIEKIKERWQDIMQRYLRPGL